jgi:hypothetical protein
MKRKISWRNRLVGGVIGLVAGVTGLAAPAISCSLEAKATSGLHGLFSLDHRGTIAIAVATHDAIEAGYIAALPKEYAARLSQLKLVRERAIAHVQKLALRSQNAGPPIAVLLTQSGAWMRFNDPNLGAIYHADPPAEGETELLLPDMVYAALLDGKMSVQGAAELGLLRVYGAEDEHAVISTFSDAIDVSVKRVKATSYFAIGALMPRAGSADRRCPDAVRQAGGPLEPLRDRARERQSTCQARSRPSATH